MRFAMGSLFALLFVALPARRARRAASLIGNVIRVPVVVLTAGSFFYSLSLLPLAEALTLSFLAPVFVALLGALLLKEKLGGRVFQALGFGLAGMLVMVWPRLQGDVSNAELGVAAALFSAVAYAFNLILLRRIAQKEHPAIIVLFQNGGPALCLAIPAALAFVPMTAPTSPPMRCRRARGRWAFHAGLGLRPRRGLAPGAARIHRADLGEPARLPDVRRGTAVHDLCRRAADRSGRDRGQPEIASAVCCAQPLGFAGKIRQVSVPCARSLPRSSTNRPSVVATVPPRWISLPSQRTVPLSGMTGRT
jgi:hypothetical protein